MMRVVKMVICVLMIGFVLSVGCTIEERQQPKVIDKRSVGHVISARVIPTSWNECWKMEIETEQYIFIVRGEGTIRKGAEVELLVYDIGIKSLIIDREEWLVFEFK